MAHFLDDDWNLDIITVVPGHLPQIDRDPQKFHLLHDGSDQLDPSVSKHGANELSGSAKKNGNGYDIIYSEKIPNPGGGFKYRVYTGNLMDQADQLGGGKKKVIGGFRSKLLNTPPKLDDVKSKKGAAGPGQNDGVWVGTQP
jgi:hypothetical protein